MEIKRKLEMSIATKRRYIISQLPTGEQTPCTACGEETLSVEQTASLFGIQQRRIFRLIEQEAVHFSETEAEAVLICLTSLAAVLDAESDRGAAADDD